MESFTITLHRTKPRTINKWGFNNQVSTAKLCVKLSDYPDARVRANAILGLAYIARMKRKLDKHIVKPVILRALREEKDYEWRIIDATEDINLFMNWKIGLKMISRFKKLSYIFL